MRFPRYQIITSIVIILLVWVAILAQQPVSSSKSTGDTTCTLALAQAPELRGFRLGMNFDQALARFPNIKVEPNDEFGLSEFYLKFESGLVYGVYDVLMESKTSATINRLKFSGYEGVNYIGIKALDNHIFFLKVSYDDTTKWYGSIDPFVEHISKTLSLSGPWRHVNGAGEAGTATKTKTLDCSDFRITAGVGEDYSTLALEDLDSGTLLEKRRTEAEVKRAREEEERRKSFKP
jgi:hypothetical protein